MPVSSPNDPATAGPAPVFPTSPSVPTSPPAPDVLSNPTPIPFTNNPPPSVMPPPPCQTSANPAHPNQPRSRVRSRTPPLSLRPSQFASSMIPQSTRRRLRLRRALNNTPFVSTSRGISHIESTSSLPPWTMPRPPVISPDPSMTTPHVSNPVPQQLSPATRPRSMPIHGHMSIASATNGSSPLLPPHPFTQLAPPPPRSSTIYSQTHTTSTPSNSGATPPPAAPVPHAPPRSARSAIDELIAVLERNAPPLPNMRNVIARTNPNSQSIPSSTPYASRPVPASTPAPPFVAPPSYSTMLPSPLPPNITNSPGLACIPPVLPVLSRSEPRPSAMLPPPTPFISSSNQSALADRTRWQGPPDTSRPPDHSPVINPLSTNAHTPSFGVPHSLWPIPPMARENELPPMPTGPVQRGISPFRSSIRPMPMSHRVSRLPTGRDVPQSPAVHLPPFVQPTVRSEHYQQSSELDVAFAAAQAMAANVNRYGGPSIEESTHGGTPGNNEDAAYRSRPAPSFAGSAASPGFVGMGHNDSGTGGFSSTGRRAVSFNLEGQPQPIGRQDDRRDSEERRGVRGDYDVEREFEQAARRARMSRILRMANHSAARRVAQVSDDMRMIFGDEELGQSGDEVNPIGQRGGTGVGPGGMGGGPRNMADAVRTFMLSDDDNDVMMMGDHDAMEDYLRSLHSRGRGGRGGYRGRHGPRGMGRMPRGPMESMLRRFEVRAMVAGRQFGVPCGLFEYSIRGRPSLTPNIDWPDIMLISDENLKPRAPVLDFMTEDNVQWCVRVGTLGNGEGDGRRGYQGFVHGLIDGGFAIELNVTGGIIYLWALSFPMHGECLLGVFRPVRTNS